VKTLPANVAIFFAVACTLASVANGQGGRRTLTQLEHTAFTQRNGAPAQVAALAQTADGYLWLGTSTGLYRFDGVTFEPFAGPPGQTVTRSDISTLLALPDGSLWIGERIGGAGVLSNGRVTSYGPRDGLPAGTVFVIARDSTGTMWAATNSGAARLDGHRWTRVGPEVGLPGTTAHVIFVDHRGGFWAATDSGVFRRALGERRFTKRDTTFLYSYEGIVEGPDGSIWGSTGNSPILLLSGANGGPPPPAHLRLGDVGPLLVARDSTLWASVDGGIARISISGAGASSRAADRTVQVLSHSLGLSGAQASALLEDREHDVWAGTDGGIDRFRVTKLVPTALSSGWLWPELVGGTTEASGVLVSGERALLRIRSDTVMQVSKIRTSLSASYRGPDGAVWVAGREGLWRVVNDVAERIEVPREAVGSSVAAIAVDGEGTLWVSVVRRGIYRRRGGAWTKFDTAAAPRPAMTIIPDGPRRVWLGYPKSEMAVVDGGTVREYSHADGLDVGNVLAIVPHGDRTWIGGELGVVCLVSGRFVPLAGDGGDRFRGVSGIIERANGDLWLHGADGVTHITADEVRRFMRDAAHRVRFERLDYHDGLQGLATQIYPLPSLHEDAAGELWIATESSLLHLDPAHVPRNVLVPPVYIRSLTAGDSTYAPSALVTLPPRTTAIDIRYTALSLPVPERVRFRYQLVGSDSAWQDVGTRREAFYTNLRPGRYRFRVIASNDDGVWNERGAEMDFVISPTFMQTRWFMLLCWLTGAAVIYLLYLLRVRMVAARLRAHFEATLAERTRIAQDLHDTLLQGFTGVTLHLHGILRALGDGPDRARTGLAQVLAHADTSLRDARLAVWDMNSRELESATLAEALESAARRAVGGGDIQLRLSVCGPERRLSRALELTTLRVASEAVSNAVKHADARTIGIAIEYRPDALALHVHDDGRGLARTVVEAAALSGHLGIAGMRERAARAGGMLDITSAITSGTTVMLVLPIPRTGSATSTRTGNAR
jgi:signal transduction histidine kinase/ligand-binding sensor domain-containing protein